MIALLVSTYVYTKYLKTLNMKCCNISQSKYSECLLFVFSAFSFHGLHQVARQGNMLTEECRVYLIGS